MKRTRLPVRFIAVAFTLPLLLLNGVAAEQSKIGTYESRAVALAYGRSTQHNQMVSKVVADAYRAKTNGDQATYKKLKEQMEKHQEDLEYQVFSDRRIDDVIKVLEPSLSEIQNKAGVDRIVDKRDAPANAVTVDVTRQLVDQFQPTEKTLKMIDDLSTKPPVKHVPKH